MPEIALQNIDPNVRAFLLMIQRAEGTYRAADPYKVLYGFGRFENFARHPNIRVPFFNPRTGRADYSTAAGAYQINYPTYVSLGMTGFTRQQQDQGAIDLLKRSGAYPYVMAGDLAKAISKASGTWASLPGSTAMQHTVAYNTLKDYFYSMLSLVAANPLKSLAIAGGIIYLLWSARNKKKLYI